MKRNKVRAGRYTAKVPKIRVRLTIVLACYLLVAACDTGTQPPDTSNTPSELPSIVATVNGRSISTKLYLMYLKNGREALELDPNTDQGRSKLEQLREGIIAELIDRTLITDEAERRGLRIPEDKIAEVERHSIAEMGGASQYEAHLTEHQLSRDEYREVLKQQIYGEMMRQELNPELSISENEVAAYYELHRKDQEFQRPEQVTAAHILVAARPNLIAQQLQRDRNLTGDALSTAVREEVERRRARAEELRQEAAAGADFAALARLKSEDPGTRERGGDLGTFGRNSHSAPFDDVAFTLKPGQISPVVQTEYGFHVIKVSGRQPSRTLTLREATPEIRRRLLAEREAKRLTEWLNGARSKAEIRVSEPFRIGVLRDQFPPL